MALAGTQEYKDSLNIVWEQKELQEQQIVTDYITHTIEPFVNHIVLSEVETVKAGNLVHLRTMISANLNTKKSNLVSIISALHPTPAVCGMPKKEAMEFILKNESHNREFYSGFLGELNYEITLAPKSSKRNIENRAYSISKKSTRLYVNLRCMQIKDNCAIVYVGGGITKSSDSMKEWEETVAKSKVIKSIL
jgi:isochorismate synthase